MIPDQTFKKGHEDLF